MRQNQSAHSIEYELLFVHGLMDRFDKLLYLGVCSDHVIQANLLKALTRKFVLEDVDLLQVAKACPLTLTGADLYALCTDANLKAITRVSFIVLILGDCQGG